MWLVPPHWSNAYLDYLEKRREVIELLRAEFCDLPRMSPPRRRELANAIYHGSVVLLSAHLEGYVESLVLEAIEAINSAHVPIVMINEKLQTGQVKESLDKLANMFGKDRTKKNIQDVMLEMQGFLSGNAWLLADDSVPCNTLRAEQLVGGDRFSNPSPKKIDNLFAYFGIQNMVGRAVGQESKPDRGIIEGKVDELIHKRHWIAHAALRVDLTREDVITYLLATRRLVRCIDIVLGQEIEKIVGHWPWIDPL
jgi:hypothetical protein